MKMAISARVTPKLGTDIGFGHSQFISNFKKYEGNT